MPVYCLHCMSAGVGRGGGGWGKSVMVNPANLSARLSQLPVFRRPAFHFNECNWVQLVGRNALAAPQAVFSSRRVCGLVWPAPSPLSPLPPPLACFQHMREQDKLLFTRGIVYLGEIFLFHLLAGITFTVLSQGQRVLLTIV